jgi:hypothetical protein
MRPAVEALPDGVAEALVGTWVLLLLVHVLAWIVVITPSARRCTRCPTFGDALIKGALAAGVFSATFHVSFLFDVGLGEPANRTLLAMEVKRPPSTPPVIPTGSLPAGCASFGFLRSEGLERPVGVRQLVERDADMVVRAAPISRSPGRLLMTGCDAPVLQPSVANGSRRVLTTFSSPGDGGRSMDVVHRWNSVPSAEVGESAPDGVNLAMAQQLRHCSDRSGFGPPGRFRGRPG